MAEALICLHRDREDLQDHLRSMLREWRVKVCASMDDVFDRLWEDGGDVDLVISEPPASCQEELFTAAGNWPDLLFVTVSDEVDRRVQVPGNVVLLERRDLRSTILSRIDRWGRRHGSLPLDRGPSN